MHLEIIDDIQIPTNFLSENSLVYIFGCNDGKLANSILNKYKCRVIGYEPFQKLFDEYLVPLSQKFSNFKCENKAVWSESGVKDYYNYGIEWEGKLNPYGANGMIERTDVISGKDSYNNILGKEKISVQCVGINECFDSEKEIDLVCFDIELSEFEVLSVITEDNLSKIKCMYVEFHNFCMKGFSKQYTESDFKSILDKIKANGFVETETSSHPDFVFYRGENESSIFLPPL